MGSVGWRPQAANLVFETTRMRQDSDALHFATSIIAEEQSFASQDFLAAQGQRLPFFVDFIEGGRSMEWIYFNPKFTQGPDQDALVLLFAEASEETTPLENATRAALK